MNFRTKIGVWVQCAENRKVGFLERASTSIKYKVYLVKIIEGEVPSRKGGGRVGA